MPTTDVLRPERQQWTLGERLWMYPPERAGGVGFATLCEYAPGRALAFGTRAIGTPTTEPENGSWAFVIQPLGDSATRLIVRGRVASLAGPFATAFDRAIFEPAHFVMERRMMIGIAQLAEGRDRGRTINHAQVVLWTVTFAVFVVASALVLLRRRWLPPLALVVASAALFQLLTLRQPLLVPTIPLVVALLAALAIVWRAAPRDGSVAS